MGWKYNPFASKTVTTVNVATVAQRLTEDGNLPDAIKTGVMKAILRDEQIADTVIEDLIGSLGVRAERAYAYAEKSYTHGSPSGDIYSSTQGRLQVEAVIEAAEGQQVLMEYSRHGAANALHVGWLKLVNQHGYNQATNQLAGLTAAKGTPVYLKNMVVMVPANSVDSYNADVLAQWGTSAQGGFTPERLMSGSALLGLTASTSVYLNPLATQLYVAVTYVWETGVFPNKQIVEGSLSIAVSDYADSRNYFQAKYLVGGTAKYFMYAQGAGTYPTLDEVYAEKPVVNGTYFPFIYFRYNKQSVIGDKTTEAYKTSKKLTKHLGIDFDTVAKGIDDNPDIADVQQAMLIMGVPAVSSNRVECRYLFDYFDNLYYVAGDGAMGALPYNLRQLSFSSDVFGTAGAKRQAFVIQDKQFKMSLSIGDISKRLVPGVIGSVGACSSVLLETQEYSTYNDIEQGQVTIANTVKTHVYKKQITPFLYEELAVRDMSMTYFVYGEYTTTGDGTDEILLVPIDMSISRELTLKEKEELYARSLHFVFNTLVITVTKVKFYQTGIFKVLMLIVAIAMIIVDGGATLGVYLGLAGTAAIIASIVILLALPAVFKLVVKLVGQDAAQVLAIALLIYAGYHFATSPGLAGVPNASQLVSFSTGLQSAVIQDLFMDLLQEQQGFFDFMKEQTKTLEAADKLLETTSFLSPFVIFGEKPEDFYNRTVHSGNVGVLSISAISSYVDIALTLPKLDESLESIGESNGMES